jgi:hypothetical protein
MTSTSLIAMKRPLPIILTDSYIDVTICWSLVTAAGQSSQASRRPYQSLGLGSDIEALQMIIRDPAR